MRHKSAWTILALFAGLIVSGASTCEAALPTTAAPAPSSWLSELLVSALDALPGAPAGLLGSWLAELAESQDHAGATPGMNGAPRLEQPPPQDLGLVPPGSGGDDPSGPWPRVDGGN
ncbi:MAG: hypothetical protein JSV80_11545 [Acidobacteriota bacterium]|nr:MAG: hypothetical protein JSV80_11545 [Acidobacteriota bacterium]